jgi:hypothetical protein
MASAELPVRCMPSYIWKCIKTDQLPNNINKLTLPTPNKTSALLHMSSHRGAVSDYFIPGHNVCGSAININTERIPIKLMLNEPSFKFYMVNCTHNSSGAFPQIAYFKHLIHIHIYVQNLHKTSPFCRDQIILYLSHDTSRYICISGMNDAESDS